MKKKLIAFLCIVQLISISKSFSQNVSINITGNTAHASAMLDITATDKGLLIPRMTQAQRTAIASPADALLVYQTDATRGFYYYSTFSASWVLLAASGTSISSLNGLTGTTQTFATGTTGNDFNISSAGAAHTFNIPDASATARGLTTTGTQTFAGAKTFSSAPFFPSLTTGSVPYIGTGGLLSQNNTNFFWDATNSRLGIGIQNPAYQLGVKDNIEIRRVGALSQLLFTNTSGTGDFRIGGDGGDLFWQGGGGRSLQMGSFQPTVLSGDRQLTTFPAFLAGNTFPNIGVLVLGQRDVSVPLAIQSNSATQTANLTNWRNSAGTVLTSIDKNGYLGIGTSTPLSPLHVIGANPLTLIGVADGSSSTADSLLTITSGLVRKLPMSTFTSSANAWTTTGNAGTVLGTNFLGTTDLKSLRFRTNNNQVLLLDSAGNVSVGNAPIQTTGTNIEKFLVDGGSTLANPTSSINLITGKGYINNYLQLNIQNKSPGNMASSDVVATSDNGDELTNYIDMGINGSGNTSNNFGGANDAYLYNLGQNLLIGTGTAGKVLSFLTGGGTQSTNERMRIDAAGRVGIGNNAPSEKLDVTGNIEFSGALMPNNQPGAIGTVLTSTGANSAPIWSSYSAANTWSTTGNASATLGTNFLGTTDATSSLRFRTNNTQRFLIDSAGNIAIGNAPVQTGGLNIEKFLVDGGSTLANPTSSINLITGKGYINNYLQL
ncbi:MAG TPA: hypothetical protein VF623_12300, partial [Segetibacter sp.]